MLGGCTVFVAADAGVEERIAAIAASQRARVARWQLLAAGVPASVVDHRVRRRRLIHEYAGVYALPGTEAIPHAADAAALLAAGPGALLSHHSAAVLWGIRPGTANPVHVIVRADRRALGRTPRVIVHRSRILTPRDARVQDGLPVTSPARAMLDVSPTLPDRDVERLLAEAIHVLKLLTIADVYELLRRAGRHPGVPRLTRVATAPLRRTESPPHTKLLGLIRQAGLDEPETEVPVLGYRVDCVWRSHRLIVEVDGYGAHSSKAKFESDRRRDAALTAAGYRVIRITSDQIDREPLATIVLIARLLNL